MKLRIFVIDDEKSIANLLRKFFVSLGHEVLCYTEPNSCNVYNAEECSHDYACGDVLFVDKNMKKMTGFEFIEEMENKGCKGIVTNKVVMSGDFSQNDIEKSKELGCLVLQKPFSLTEISKTLSNIEREISYDRKLEPLENIL